MEESFMAWAALRHFHIKGQSDVQQPAKETENETPIRKEIIHELR